MSSYQLHPSLTTMRLHLFVGLSLLGWWLIPPLGSRVLLYIIYSEFLRTRGFLPLGNARLNRLGLKNAVSEAMPLNLCSATTAICKTPKHRTRKSIPLCLYLETKNKIHAYKFPGLPISLYPHERVLC